MDATGSKMHPPGTTRPIPWVSLLSEKPGEALSPYRSSEGAEPWPRPPIFFMVFRSVWLFRSLSGVQFASFYATKIDVSRAYCYQHREVLLRRQRPCFTHNPPNRLHARTLRFHCGLDKSFRVGYPRDGGWSWARLPGSEIIPASGNWALFTKIDLARALKWYSRKCR
ncbi:hypothetical protein C8R46DRAFT_1094869 [Mycena filopes]|nr:hypothetical protein C8R46DRAFT_1094869 [Mycena filopes]